MLHLYYEKEALASGKEIIRDVEHAFFRLKSIPDTESSRRLIHLIDKGTYNDPGSFLDRFGFKLYTSELSTGCKAGICIVAYPDKIVDTRECGNNALDAIISYCNTGSAIIYPTGASRVQLSDSIDVMLEGEHFDTVDDLNYYIEEVR